MREFISERKSYVWLLTFSFIAYFGFHAVREKLAPGSLRDSFPSLLTPLAMFGIAEFLPSVRFRSRWIKFGVLATTTLVAAVWLEAVVPRWADRATGDVMDAVAMGIGFLVYWVYDSIGTTARGESDTSSETCRSTYRDVTA